MLTPTQGSARVRAAFALSGVQEKQGEEDEGVKTGSPEVCAAQLLSARGQQLVLSGCTKESTARVSFLSFPAILSEGRELAAFPGPLCPSPTALTVSAYHTFLFPNLLTLSVSPASCSNEFGCLIMH